MSFQYTAFRMPANMSELADKIQRKGFERKVDLTVLIQDDFHNFGKIPGLLFIGQYNLRASIITDYVGLVTAHENPEIYLKRKLGRIYWGLILPPTRAAEPSVFDVQENLKRLIEQIQKNRLAIENIILPEFLRY